MLARTITLEAMQEKEEFILKTEETPEDRMHFKNQSFLYDHRDHLCVELTINGEAIFLRSGILIDRQYMDKEDTSKRERQPYLLKENCAFIRSRTLLLTSGIEREANLFAAYLLITDDMLTDYMGYTQEHFCSCTGYPKELVKLRLHNI